MSLDLAGTNEVVRSVAEDRHHIGLVYNARPDPQIRIAAASRQPICLVARPDHPLVRRGSPVRLRELVGLPLGLMHSTYGTRQIIAMAEASDKIGLSPKLTTGSIGVLRQFIKADMGVTLLPAFSITTDIADGTLVAVPVDNPVLAHTEAQVITRLGRVLPTAASQLLRFLVGQMRAFRDVSIPRRGRAEP
jgi:DNA-binding transcriptional LysR family regulator